MSKVLPRDIQERFCPGCTPQQDTTFIDNNVRRTEPSMGKTVEEMARELTENHCSKCEHFGICSPAHLVNECPDKTWFKSTLTTPSEIRAKYAELKGDGDE